MNKLSNRNFDSRDWGNIYLRTLFRVDVEMLQNDHNGSRLRFYGRLGQENSPKVFDISKLERAFIIYYSWFANPKS